MDNIVWNKCQTPLEELELGKYPDEVQEQFWDFLNNVPFIKWMVSPNRPMISELPRDEHGRAIIDITKPPILEGSDYFRQTAFHEWSRAFLPENAVAVGPMAFAECAEHGTD